MSQPVPDPLSSVDGLLARFGGYLRRAAARHGLDETDVSEVEQEVRIRLWHAVERGALRPTDTSLGAASDARSESPPENLTAATASYVLKTVLSAVRDVLRRRQVVFRKSLRLPPDHSPLVPSVPALAEQQLVREDLGNIVAAALERLIMPRRVAVRLHLSGYSRSEIAQWLGWSEPKTRNLIYRGLQDLREVLTIMGVTVRGMDDG